MHAVYTTKNIRMWWRHNNHYDDGTKKSKTQEANETKTASKMTAAQIERNLSEQQKYSHFLLFRSCQFLRKECCFSIFQAMAQIS